MDREQQNEKIAVESATYSNEPLVTIVSEDLVSEDP